MALIGAGGQGLHNTRALFEEDDCQIIALADPAEEWDLSQWYYGGKSGRGPARALIEEHYAAKTPNFKCAVYEDFRVMLEKEKSIDAVLIATPDHNHAYVSIAAMKAGKHVYCEKPLSHNIREARLVARVAKETGVATQMGNQGRSGEGHRLTVEWLNDGAIGAVREVHAWSGNAKPANKPFAPAGPPVKPAGLNWDLWLGTRAERPYKGAYTPVQLAVLLGLRQRHHARHGNPPFRSRVQRARTRRAAHRGGEGLTGGSRVDHGKRFRDLPLWRAGEQGPCHGLLVRQRPPAARRRSASIPTTRASGWAKETTAC